MTARPLSSADWATLPRTRIVCSPVVALERLRYADDEPLAIMRNWIPQVLVELTPELLERAGLYQVMRASGIRLHLASQTIGARRGHRGGGAPAPRRQAGAGAHHAADDLRRRGAVRGVRGITSTAPRVTRSRSCW